MHYCVSMTFGSGYDAWLEAPYRERADRDALMERYIEIHGLDEDEANELDFDTVAEYFDDLAGDAAIERAEAERDDPYYDDDPYW